MNLKESYKPHRTDCWVVGDPLFRTVDGEWHFSTDVEPAHIQELIGFILQREDRGEKVTESFKNLVYGIIESVLVTENIIKNFKNLH